MDGTTVHSAVQYFSDKIKENDFPSDGLVMIYDDINYGLSLGTTAKFPRNAIAFKWKDETVLTTLREIEWSASRTGLINPVAIFDPVELEGTTVTRASVHNVSIVKELKLGIGDKITVYKANMIIPQIAENITSSGTAVIPDKCPVCGENTQIIESAGASFLYCVNKDCSAKHIKRFEHFCERNALNIEGISMQTLDKFIECGYIKEFEDIYHLDRYEERIVSMDGFGKKSYDNMIESINNSRTAMLANVIYGLGIDGIGLAGARLICRYFEDDVYKVINATKDELLLIDGIGEVLADSYVKYFSNEKNRKEFELLLKELHLVKEERNTNSPVSGKTFVITGSLNHYANRDELKAVIEQNGGKTTGSVSAKTDYLINNDLTSNSSKNKKAKELGIPIISEDDFIKFLE